jgi:large subunit ribosomal protein LX
MAKFVIDGEMPLGKQQARFTKEVEAASEKLAIELLYSLMGSKHGLKRQQIRISSVKKE